MEKARLAYPATNAPHLKASVLALQGSVDSPRPPGPCNGHTATMNPVRLPRGLGRGPPATGPHEPGQMGAPRSDRLNWPEVPPTLGPRMKIPVSPLSPVSTRWWGMWTTRGFTEGRT